MSFTRGTHIPFEYRNTYESPSCDWSVIYILLDRNDHNLMVNKFFSVD